MIKKRRLKQAIAFGMAVVMSASINFGNIVNEAATIEEYYKKSTRITMSSSKGIKKITVNGKKVKIKKNAKKVIYSFKKQGKYIVKMTNKQNKTTSKIIYIDKKAPEISGVEDGKTYDRAVTISVSDNFKVQSATLNGRKFDGKYTIGSEGDYIVIVTDFAGNKESVSFTVKFANSSNSGVNYGGGSSGSDASSSNSNSVTEEPKDKSTVTPKVTATPVVTKIPTPVATKASTPVATQTPTPVATKAPIPVVSKTPTPVVTKAPTPVVSKTPTPVVTSTPIAKEHVWKEVNRFDATCTKDGVIKYVCTDCGEEKFETIKAVGHHVYTDKTVEISAATLAEDATYSRVCDNCGEAEDEVRVMAGSHTDHNPPRIWADVFYKDTDDYSGDYYKDLWHPIISGNIDMTKADGSNCVMAFWNSADMTKPLDTGNHRYASVSIAFDETQDKGSGIKNVQVVMNSYLESEAATFTVESEYNKMCKYYDNYKLSGKMTETAFNPEYPTGTVKLKFSKDDGFAQYIYVLVEDLAGNVSIMRSVRIF